MHGFHEVTMNNRIAVLGMFLALCIPAAAIGDGEVMYVSGTAPSLPANTIGRLDLTQPESLVFEHSGVKFTIPYAAVESFEYSRQVTRHLGVLPAIAIGLIKQRRHRHFFRISYRDENKVPQVVIFEVPKQMPATFQAVLATRAPQSCKPFLRCGQRQ
jgi:hypothetical protein